ncbi:hypothetical protein [Caudoviricetes sp.]|nr:hypothetical protein [Caudoviricetes sp.]
MPSGLGQALAAGFTGYMQGQQAAEQRRYERQQEAEKIKRDAERDALQKLLLEHQMRMSGDQNRRANEAAEQGAIDKGFRPVGSQWDTFNDAIGLDPSSLPTTTVNGVTMRRSAPSAGYGEFITKHREARIDETAQAAKDAAAREAALAALPASARKLAGALPTSALQSAAGSLLTRQLTPKEQAPVQWDIRETAQGLVQINPRTGEVRPLQVDGQPLSGTAKTGQPTESERRGGALLTVAEKSNAELNQLGDPSFATRAFGSATQTGRQYKNAATAFARSYLYLVSGANATDSESQALADQIIPSALDNEDTRKAKAERRVTMLAAMRSVAGRAAPAADAVAGGSPNVDALRSQAVDVIRKGADPNAVAARFKKLTGQDLNR